MFERVFRIASISVPSWIAWCVAFSAENQGHLPRVVRYGFGPLWGLVAVLLVMRAAFAITRPRTANSPSRLAELDILTDQGTVLSWLSAIAVLAALVLGWASLAVVGVLATGLFHVVVLYTLLTVRGGDPLRGIALTRRFVPAIATEGDDVTEELTFAAPRIPVGFRLFATGSVGPRWATTRHVLDATEAGAEIVVESEIGPAVRGEHDGGTIDVWLEDTFGICRSATVQLAPASITVLPKTLVAEKTPTLLERGDGPRAPRPAHRLPTEGSFALREYQQGDDVRRIHWVRSVAARELVVRLPDELPPDRPQVRLVLDTFFPEARTLTCETTADVLDTLVGVWLAVAKSLTDSGARVTLVTAVSNGKDVVPVRRMLSGRSSNDTARRLGAEVAWQDQLMAEDLFTSEATFVVGRAVVARQAAPANVRWIVLRDAGQEVPWPTRGAALLQFPMGTPDNRWSLRRAAESRKAIQRRDHGRALVAMSDVMRPPAKSFIAVRTLEGTVRLQMVSQ